jgi:prepilin-type N-terminal cleavage/methylation domain-containing protein
MRSSRVGPIARAWNAAFTLVEVIVALAVILILAAVSVPSLNGYLDQKNVEATATQLATVRDALYNTSATNVAFWQRVTAGASRLSQLSNVIVSGNAPLGDSCKVAFVANDVTRWNNFGPFVNFPISSATGLVTPIGIAVDTMTRVPFSATAGRIRINFLNSVDLANAQLLDGVVDAGDGNVAGVVQWVLPAVNGVVTMYYFVAISNIC